MAAIQNLLSQGLNIGTGIGLSYCAFFLMLGGYQWMGAQENPQKKEGAMSSLKNSGIGLVIVLLAQSIAAMIGSAAGSPS